MSRHGGPAGETSRRQAKERMLEEERWFLAGWAFDHQPLTLLPAGACGGEREVPAVRGGPRRKVCRVVARVEEQCPQSSGSCPRTPGLRPAGPIDRTDLADACARAQRTVRHGHFTADGLQVELPSFTTGQGVVISVGEQGSDRECSQMMAKEMGRRNVPGDTDRYGLPLPGLGVQLLWGADVEPGGASRSLAAFGRR